MKLLLRLFIVTVLSAFPAMSAPPAEPAAIPTVPSLEKTSARLKKQRDVLMKTPLVSITFDKKVTAPSGDPRDYVSFGIYWWPDPKQPNGLPYLRRDGHINPEAVRSDLSKINRLHSSIRDIGLLYYFTNDEELAAHGALLLRTFFTDSRTGMKPHLTYAQGIPGRLDGRPIGIIDTYILIDVVNAITMLKKSKAMTPELYRDLQQWFSQYLDWLLTEPPRRELKASTHNIGIAYHSLIINFAVFCGRYDLARQYAEHLQKLLPQSINAQGIMPQEVGRTRSWDYSIYALNIILSAVPASRSQKIDLLAADSLSGQRLRLAVDYLCGFIPHPEKWPYQQLHGPIQLNHLGNILLKMYAFTQEERYLQAFNALKQPQYDPATVLLCQPAR